MRGMRVNIDHIQAPQGSGLGGHDSGQLTSSSSGSSSDSSESDSRTGACMHRKVNKAYSEQSGHRMNCWMITGCKSPAHLKMLAITTTT